MKRTLKVFLAAAMAVAMLFSFASAAEDNSVGASREENHLGAFVDAPAEDSWKFQGLNCAVENGVMNGHENKLRPDDSLTRAEMVAMMVRVLGAYANKADIESYVDVALGEWYYDTMQSGVAIKIINGAGNKMMPNDAITREQTFTILARAFLHMENDKGAADNFSDAGAVSDWAKPATNALIESGVVQGDTTNTIRPKADVTRAEFAAMLNRIAGHMSKQNGDYAGKTVSGSFILNDSSVNLDGAVIEGDLYITDAIGTDTIDLSNVTVTGRIVIRGGEVNIKAGTSAAQVVIGNPTNNTTVKADEGVKVDKVVIAENSNDVVINVPAEEVVIKSESSEVTIGKDAGSVKVDGKDNTVKVESGAKVENVTTEGDNTKVEVDRGATVDKVTVEGANSSISGSGNVGSATVNGSGSTVTTPNTNVTDNTKPSGGDDNKPDDGKDDDNQNTPSGGGGGTLPGGTTAVTKVVSAYLTYEDGSAPLYATVANNEVKFDFTGVDKDKAFKEICVETEKGTSVDCVHDLVTFKSDVKVSLATLLGDIVDKNKNANDNQIVGILDTEELTHRALIAKMDLAYDMYELYRDAFASYDIVCDSETQATFTGKIGNNDPFKLVLIVKP